VNRAHESLDQALNFVGTSFPPGLRDDTTTERRHEGKAHNINMSSRRPSGKRYGVNTDRFSRHTRSLGMSGRNSPLPHEINHRPTSRSSTDGFPAWVSLGSAMGPFFSRKQVFWQSSCGGALKAWSEIASDSPLSFCSCVLVRKTTKRRVVHNHYVEGHGVATGLNHVQVRA